MGAASECRDVASQSLATGVVATGVVLACCPEYTRVADEDTVDTTVALVAAEETLALDVLNEDNKFCADDLRRIVGRAASENDMVVGRRTRRDCGYNPANAPFTFTTMADIHAIAQQFTDFYYQTFDTNRANLSGLYVRDKGNKMQTTLFLISVRILFCSARTLCLHSRARRSKESVQSLKSLQCVPSLFLVAFVYRHRELITVAQNLPFQKVAHKVITRDAQPSSPSVASMIVSVTGQLAVRICLNLTAAS